MTTTAIRNKLYDYIRVAEDKKLLAIYNLIEKTSKWWENIEITKELDNRYNALETGTDKGFTTSELTNCIIRPDASKKIW
jgi:hypothetical protein